MCGIPHTAQTKRKKTTSKPFLKKENGAQLTHTADLLKNFEGSYYFYRWDWLDDGVGVQISSKHDPGRELQKKKKEKIKNDKTKLVGWFSRL